MTKVRYTRLGHRRQSSKKVGRHAGPRDAGWGKGAQEGRCGCLSRQTASPSATITSPWRDRVPEVVCASHRLHTAQAAAGGAPAGGHHPIVALLTCGGRRGT